MRGLLVLLSGLVLASPSRANPPSVLDRVPQEASFVLVVEQPRQLLEAVYGHDLAGKVQELPQVQEQLNSTAGKRFFQLLSYIEQEAGDSWPELIDALAGNGFALAADITRDPAPVLFIAEGREAKRSAQLFQLGLKLLEAELARSAGDGADAPKLQRQNYLGQPTVQLGDEFFAAQLGRTIYVANRQPALQAAIKLAQAKEPTTTLARRPELKQARLLLGANAIGWFWLDFAVVKDQPNVKEFFAASRKDLIQTLVLGSTIDAFRRTNLLVGGLYREGRGVRARLRLPVKRADLPTELAVHVPPPGQPGSLPFLEPKNVLYSQSFHLDLAAMWKDRRKLFNDEVLPQLETAERDLTKLVPGLNIGAMLEKSGPHHRFVAVSTDYPSYQTRPDQPLPAFALVSTFTDPEFARLATNALRAGALAATFQFGLRMNTDDRDGVRIVSYRFPENKPLADDPENLRFNFVPSFAVVGQHLVMSSQPGLIQDLLPDLQRSLGPASPAVWRAQLYGGGAAEFQKLIPDSTLSQLVLNQGISLEEAQRQFKQLGELLRQLGTVTVELDHAEKWFEVQAVWQPK